MPKASRSNNGLRGSCALGVDIVEIGRVRDAARRRPRFLARVFSEEEIAYCRAKANPWPHFAVRFAAKEAVWKALSPSNLGLKDICVGRRNSGEPEILIRRRPARAVKISLSHSRDYALAVALLAAG